MIRPFHPIRHPIVFSRRYLYAPPSQSVPAQAASLRQARGADRPHRGRDGIPVGPVAMRDDTGTLDGESIRPRISEILEGLIERQTDPRLSVNDIVSAL